MKIMLALVTLATTIFAVFTWWVTGAPDPDAEHYAMGCSPWV